MVIISGVPIFRIFTVLIEIFDVTPVKVLKHWISQNI